MAITLAQAQANLDAALEALAKARADQQHQVSTTQGGRQVVRALHESLLNEVKFWEEKVSKLEQRSNSCGIRVRRGVPHD